MDYPWPPRVTAGMLVAFIFCIVMAIVFKGTTTTAGTVFLSLAALFAALLIGPIFIGIFLS